MAEEVTALRRRIGYVIQQVGLFPHLTIGENVAVVPRLLGLGGAPATRADRRTARPRRPRSRALSRSVSRAALGWRAPAGGRGARSRRRPAGDADGRAVRRRRSDRARPAAERVPAAPGRPRQDDPLRDPRHRRGHQDGRPRRGDGAGRPPRAVRAAGRDPGEPGVGVRGAVRRRRPRPQAPRPREGARPRAAAGGDGTRRGGRRRSTRPCGRFGVPVPPPRGRRGPTDRLDRRSRASLRGSRIGEERDTGWAARRARDDRPRRAVHAARQRGAGGCRGRPIRASRLGLITVESDRDRPLRPGSQAAAS